MTEVLKFRGISLTLKQCKAHARTIRSRAEPGVPLKGDDRWFIGEMWRLYHDGNPAPHPQSITVQVSGRFRAFCAHCADGETRFFSLNMIGRSRDARRNQRFGSASRYEVWGQTIAAVDKAYTDERQVTCAITGDPLPRENATVDHWPVGFRSILNAWLSANNLDWRDIELTKTPNCSYFTDRELGRSWREYHRTHAQYRIASAEANEAQGNPQHNVPTSTPQSDFGDCAHTSAPTVAGNDAEAVSGRLKARSL
jgi:hypothetical protein